MVLIAGCILDQAIMNYNNSQSQSLDQKFLERT